ncbi:MAG: cobalt transporter [Thermosynechococcaceae cyanobacterium]
MKPLQIASSILAVSLVVGTPNPVFAHVGHGDEFQAEGGINRVAVNAENDSLLGIEVNPIEPASDGSAAVLIPATALVDANGKQLVFVQYKDFYEPVPVTTGATQGDLIEVTQGLSVKEKLVTQGSLSLYAESRKTQNTAETAASPPDAVASPQTHAQADAEGIPHSHDGKGDLVSQADETAPQSSGFPMGILAAVAGGIAVLVGVFAFVGGGSKKKGTLSNKKGDY